MCNILYHKGNANENINIPSVPSQNSYDQENKQQMLVEMWGGKGLLYTVGGNINSTATIEILTEVPQKMKTRTTI
jgi:hypothetical protein